MNLEGRTGLLRNPVVLLVAGLVVGIILGILFAWVIYPPDFTNGQAYQLGDFYRQYYLESVTRDWLQDKRDDLAAARLGSHAGDLLLVVQSNPAWTPIIGQKREDVIAMLQVAKAREELAGGGTGAAGPNWALYGALCLVGVAVVVGIGAAGWYISSRRSTAGAPSTQPGQVTGAAMAPPADFGQATPPVAQFTSKYIGTDIGYDDSFSIDTPVGTFLGECGVGVSETVGTTTTGEPKKITALEVWLFDKNDIRTVTKVLMSEHAFYDDALRAKLAPKGEAILARVGETVMLETATLQVSARVVELEYASAPSLPGNSCFGKVTIELAAWSREAPPAPPAA